VLGQAGSEAVVPEQGVAAAEDEAVYCVRSNVHESRDVPIVLIVPIQQICFFSYFTGPSLSKGSRHFRQPLAGPEAARTSRCRLLSSDGQGTTQQKNPGRKLVPAGVLRAFACWREGCQAFFLISSPQQEKTQASGSL
jgi:hypothetical protein